MVSYRIVSTHTNTFFVTFRLHEAGTRNVSRRKHDQRLFRLPHAAGQRAPDVRFRRHRYLLSAAAASWYSAVGTEHQRKGEGVYVWADLDVAVRREVARCPAISTRFSDEDYR